MLRIRKELDAASLGLVRNLDEVNISEIKSAKCHWPPITLSPEGDALCFFPERRVCLAITWGLYAVILYEKVAIINPDERNQLLLYSGA